MRSLLVLLTWFCLSLSAAGQSAIAPSLDQLQRELTALRQLGGAITSGGDSGAPAAQSFALLEVVSKRNFANDLIVLLNAARDADSIPENVRGADLLREVFSEPGARLPDFLPWSWKSIQPELCRAAGLAEERCISLVCLIPALDPEASRFCPLPLALPAPLEPAPPVLPDDPAAFRQWLLDLAAHLEPLGAPIAVQLRQAQLPVDAQIMAAKGELHAIWPILIDRTRALVDIKASDMEPIIRDIVADNARRLSLAAQILAAAAAVEDLPQSLRDRLDAPALAALAASARSLQQAYDDMLETGDYGLLLDRRLDTAIESGRRSLETLGRSVATSTGALTAEIEKLVDAALLDCPKNDPAGLYEIATSSGDLPVSLALQGPTSSGAEFAAELVLAFRVPEPPALKILQDGVLQDVEIAEKLADCIAQHSIVPLGITISHLVRDGDTIRINADSETLVQASDTIRFAEGLDLWIERMNGVPLPATLTITGVTADLSPDFGTVALTLYLNVPIIGVPLEARVTIARDGKVVLEPSAATLIDMASLVRTIDARLGRNSVEAGIGPLTATLEAALPADAALRPSGTWLALTGDLRLGRTTLGKAQFHLVGDGSPRLSLASDLTALLHQGPLADLAADAVAAFAAAIPAFGNQILADIGKAVLIENVAISPDGAQIHVTLALSPLIMPGINGSIRHTGALDPSRADLGIAELYAGLARAAMADGSWVPAVLARFEAPAADIIEAELQALIANLRQTSAAILGLQNVDISRQGDGRFALLLAWTDGDATVQNIGLDADGPSIDLRDAQLSAEDQAELGLFLQTSIVSRVNALVGLGWTGCGTPLAQVTARGIAISIAVETDLVGCVPLPPASFDGRGLHVDTDSVLAVIRPMLAARLMLLIPEDYRRYASLATHQPADGMAFDVRADVGIGVPLTGVATISFKDLRLTVHVDKGLGKALFGAALGSVAELLGDSIAVEEIPGQFGLRASAVIDLDYFSIGVTDMEITPRRITIPEIRLRLPMAMAIGPFTIVPVEIRARLRDPMAVTLIGDISFLGLNAIMRLRGSFGMDIPPKTLSVHARLIMLEALELFESRGSIAIAEGSIDANSRTTGVLAAILPLEQRLKMDKTRASLTSSGKIIAISFEANGEISFRQTPAIALSGSARAGGLADLSMTFASDLELNNPEILVSGGLDFLLGDISLEARATRRNVRLTAEVIGIRASLLLPSADDLNAGLIRKLFEFLLKPSLDLDSISSLNISLSPQVGGGNGGGAIGGDDGGGDKGGGEDVGGEQNTAGGGEKVVTPRGFLLTGSVPSAWQSGFRPAPDASGYYCDAIWRGPNEADIVWTGNLRYPVAVATMLANPPKPYIRWQQPDTVVSRHADCALPLYDTIAWTWLFFDGTPEPKSWIEGTDTLIPLPWVEEILQKVDGRSAASVTAASMPSTNATRLIGLMAQENIGLEAVHMIASADGASRFLIVMPGAGAPTHLIGNGRARSFAATDPIGGILAQILADPIRTSPLISSLLPELLTGGYRGQALAFWPDGRLLLSGHYGSRAIAFAVPPHEGQLGCGQHVASHNLVTGRDGILYDAITRRLLAQPEQACSEASEWTQLLGVTTGTALERIVALRDAGDEWSVDFVDARAMSPGCLRRGLDAPALEQLLSDWADLDAIAQDQIDSLLGEDRGLTSILRAALTPELNWLDVGFPLDPFAIATCETQP